MMQFDLFNRRTILMLFGSTATTGWPLAVRAQQRATPVLAVLSGGSSDFPAFTRGLAERGYQNGRNVRIEFVSGRYDNTMQLLADEVIE